MESPSAWEVFLHQGLPITGVGMGLVFLTLIIVAIVIWGLDKLFKTPIATDDGDDEPEVVELTEPTMAEVESDTSDVLGQVAAIAVALTLQSARAKPAAAAAASGWSTQSVAPLPWQTVADVDDEEITGEVITVTNFAGSASWKARGRLDSQE